MSPMRPIHRWKSFWAGILVITFLAWAWRDSTRCQTALDNGRYIITHAGSGISFADRSVSLEEPSWERRSIDPSIETWSRAHIEPPLVFLSTGKPEQFPLYYDFHEVGKITARTSAARHLSPLAQWTIAGPEFTDFITGSRAIYLPHWLLITLFLIPWLALLIWRTLRIRHLTAERAEIGNRAPASSL